MVRLIAKVKSSSLIETVVATVIIIVVFTIASLTLTTVMSGITKSNTFKVQNRLDFLFYKIDNEQLELPYEENYDQFTLELFPLDEEDIKSVILKATHKEGKVKLEQQRWIE